MTARSAGRDHWIWGLLAAAVVAGGAAWVFSAQRPAPPERRLIKDFLLTERGGTMLSRQRFQGRVWIASFFFIRCSESCPKLIEALERLHRDLAGTQVRLVSFSVDPAHDSVERLRTFAAAHGADSDRWWLLTGARDQIRDLAEKSFLVSVVERPEAPLGQHVTHSNRLFVVDREGRVLGTGQEVVRRSADGTFVIDERALRQIFLQAVDEDRGWQIGLADLPLLNATLNGTAAVLLLLGWVLIRAGWYQAHGMALSLAFVTSAFFFGVLPVLPSPRG